MLRLSSPSATSTPAGHGAPDRRSPLDRTLPPHRSHAQEEPTLHTEDRSGFGIGKVALLITMMTLFTAALPTVAVLADSSICGCGNAPQRVYGGGR